MEFQNNVQSIKSGELVTIKIFDLLITGKIKSGDKLPSAENISKEYGVSIISTREALQSLQAIGLVRILHGKGIYATEGGTFIEEALEARKTLECHNVRAAAEKVTDSQLQQFESLIEKMDACIANRDFRAYSDYDHEFHLLIAKSAGNRILFKVYENIKVLLYYQQSAVNEYPGNMDVSSKQHKNILKAIKDQDPELARSRMAEHLDEALKVWKQAISNG